MKTGKKNAGTIAFRFRQVLLYYHHSSDRQPSLYIRSTHVVSYIFNYPKPPPQGAKPLVGQGLLIIEA